MCCLGTVAWPPHALSLCLSTPLVRGSVELVQYVSCGWQHRAAYLFSDSRSPSRVALDRQLMALMVRTAEQLPCLD